MSNSTQCTCNPCPGAACQCGCQSPQVETAKTVCPCCGDACQCAPAPKQ